MEPQAKLEQVIQLLETWTKSLATDTAFAALSIRRTIASSAPTIAGSPSRGVEAELALRKVKSSAQEVQAILGEVNDLLLDARAPWNSEHQRRTSGR